MVKASFEQYRGVDLKKNSEIKLTTFAKFNFYFKDVKMTVLPNITIMHDFSLFKINLVNEQN